MIMIHQSLLILLENNGRARRDVQFQPLLVVFYVERIEISEVSDRIIGKAMTAKLLRIRIEHHLVTARRHQEAIVGVRARGREVEHKDKVATHEGEYLVAVVMPYLNDRLLLEVANALHHAQHLTVEVAQPMVTEVVIVYQVPLTTGVLIAPAVAFAREVNPFGMSNSLPMKFR